MFFVVFFFGFLKLFRFFRVFLIVCFEGVFLVSFFGDIMVVDVIYLVIFCFVVNILLVISLLFKNVIENVSVIYFLCWKKGIYYSRKRKEIKLNEIGSYLLEGKFLKLVF